MKTIAIDIGNVCVEIDKSNCTKRLSGLSPEVQRELFKTAEELERGKIEADDFLNAADRLTGNRYGKAEILDAFNSILIRSVPGMEKLVWTLPVSGFSPVFFSDISTIHLARFKEIFRAARLISNGVYSFQVGYMKPSLAFFTAYEENFGIPALYVDDRIDLVIAARLHGWRSHLFTGVENLQQELATL